jgi:hypothetical protein
VSLTADQAAKFWTLFEKYQREQSAIMDRRISLAHQVEISSQIPLVQ